MLITLAVSCVDTCFLESRCFHIHIYHKNARDFVGNCLQSNCEVPFKTLTLNVVIVLVTDNFVTSTGAAIYDISSYFIYFECGIIFVVRESGR